MSERGVLVHHLRRMQFVVRGKPMIRIKRSFPMIVCSIVMLSGCSASPAVSASPSTAATAPPVAAASVTVEPTAAILETTAPTALEPQATSTPAEEVLPTSTEQDPETTNTPVLEANPYCPAGEVLLDIPDRDEDEIAPEEGWCGETSIQSALDYFGKTVSQSVIHAAGKPQHPDLWEDDIPVALKALGAEYSAWDRNDPDLDGFMRWIGGELQQGRPLVLGVKIYPDETGWENDHFVLAVGCDVEGLYLNTNNTGDGQYYATFEELTQNFEDSYSFVNADDVHYGWSVHGLR